MLICLASIRGVAVSLSTIKSLNESGSNGGVYVSSVKRLSASGTAFACVFVLVGYMPLTIAENADPVIEMDGVDALEFLFIDRSDFSRKAHRGEPIMLEILENAVTFSLSPCSYWDDEIVVIGSSGMRDKDAERDLARVNTYRGVNLVNLDSVHAMVTPTWLHIRMTLSGTDYIIDAADRTGQSGWYALYTPANVKWDTVDLLNDVLGSTLDNDEALPCGDSPILEEKANQVEDDDDFVQYELLSGGSCSEYRICAVTLAADVEWRNRHPDDWENWMTAAIFDISSEYEPQVGVTFRIESIVEVPADECTDRDAEVLVEEFHDWVLDDQPSQTRNLAVLCTGKWLIDGTAGIAMNIPGVGSRRFTNDDLAFAVVSMSATTVLNKFVMGHEIGHLFNGVHPYSHWKDNWLTPDELSWMFPWYLEDVEGIDMVTEFSGPNKNRISAWARETLDRLFRLNHGQSDITEHGLYAEGYSIESDEFYYKPTTDKQMSVIIRNTQSVDVWCKSLYFKAITPSGWAWTFGAMSYVRIPANSYITYEADWYPAQGGDWDIWVEYLDYEDDVNSFSLHMYPITRYAVAFRQGPHELVYANDDWDICAFYKFYIFSCYTSNANYIFEGQTVWTYFSLFCAQIGATSDEWPWPPDWYDDLPHDADDYAEFSEFNTKYSTPSGSISTFGSIGGYELPYVSDTNADLILAGGGITVDAESPPLTQQGTYTFWPNFVHSSGANNFMEWHSIDITVTVPAPAPGCVLEGTQILLPDGTTELVENLKRNDMIAGYDIENESLVTETITMNKREHVAAILNINDGLVSVTPVCQPIYIRNDTFVGWIVDPQDLQIGWELFNPVDGQWIEIFSLEHLEGRFVVYDLGATDPDNYIANGILLDRKPIKG